MGEIGLISLASLPGPAKLTAASLPLDPLTDIQRAIVDFCPVRFESRQESYGLAVHQTYVFEIESQCTAFLFQQGPKRVHVVPCNPPTDAQNHTILSNCLALDFAGHCERLNVMVSRLVSLQSKPLATRNLLKTKERVCRSRRAYCEPREFREFREFHEFRKLDRDAGVRSPKFELEFVDFQGPDARLKSRWWNSELSRRP